jgi:hypothetical protein
MKKPRISILIITSQFVLLLFCLGYLAVVLVRNYCLKMEAKRYASSAGIANAKSNFSHGRFWLYQIKQLKFDGNGSGTWPTDGSIDPAGKTDGQFQVYYFVVDTGFPAGHLEVQQAYVDSYNDRMRMFFNHSNWFDKYGERIPSSDLKGQTNSP